MKQFQLLILIGPCLMTAVTAGGLFLAWRTLSRVPHVLAWSGAFAAMAMAIFVRAVAIGEKGVVPNAATIIVQLLGVTTTVLLAHGFSCRVDQHGFVRRTAWLWAATAAAVITLNLAPAPRGVAAALAATIQGGVLLWSAAIMARGRDGGSIAEQMAQIVLIVVGLLRFGTAVIEIASALELRIVAGYNWVPALMIEPAAVGLLAMFLIASDLSVDLNRLAWTDALTGLMNRAGFEDAAVRALRRSRRPDRPLSIAIADIDRFKAINDRFGHIAGDAALRCFAVRIAAELGDDGVVGRIGGEEFALLLPHKTGAAALAVVEALREAAAGSKVDGHAEVRLTASFGIAEMRDGEELAGLLARADSALYRSKQSGRNRCSLAAGPQS